MKKKGHLPGAAHGGPGGVPKWSAAEIVPAHPNAQAMRGLQDSNLRGGRWVSTLMLKIKRNERQTEAMEATAAFHDALEKKEVSCQWPESCRGLCY
jgi:hypothetical protein